MSASWQPGPVPQGYTVTHFDRGRGHTALHSMAGPEFTGVGAVYAPLGLLPPVLRLVAVGVLLLVAVGACAALKDTGHHYPPSPNICRSVNSGVPPEKPGSCVPSGEVSGGE